MAELSIPMSRGAFWDQLKKSRIPETLEDVEDVEGDVRLKIKACDDELAFAQAYIQEIGARRNALLSINQFPSEILGYIFRFLLPVLEPQPLDTLHRRRDERAITSGTRTLITASHVCQRWRDVALEHSALWTILWIGNTSWMHEMLIRSRGTPLIIMEPQQHSVRRMYRGLLLPKDSPNIGMNFLASRLFHEIQPKWLYLAPPCEDASVATLWDEVLVRPAPNLETLEILGSHHPSCPGVMHIPSELLGRCAPALKHLSLAGIFSYDSALWTSPILHQLVSLTLDVHYMNGADMDSRIPLQAVLNALQEMQQLENLSITFPSLRIESPLKDSPYLVHHEHDHSLVQLPRLSSLYLSGVLIEISSLTAHLIIPRNATVRYTAFLREDDVDAGLSGNIARLLHPTLPLSPLRTSEITLVNSYDCTLQLRCWDHTLPAHSSAMEDLGRPRIALEFWLPSPPLDELGMLPQAPDPAATHQAQKLLEIFRAVSSIIPFDQIHDLHWDNPDKHSRNLGSTEISIDEPVLTEVLSHFGQAKRLFFTDTLHCPDMISATASNPVLLPHLASIHFASTLSRELLVQDRAAHAGWPGEEARVRDLLQELASGLRRLAETRDIQTLEWSGGLLPEEHVPLFEGIAKHLVCEL